MYQFVSLNSYDYNKRVLIEINVATDNLNSRNEAGYWPEKEIGVALKS